MKVADFSRLSVDELMSIQETISEILASKISEERRNLELRMERLNRFDPSHQPLLDDFARLKRIPAKYQNPDDPTETWAGRGKTPRWMAAAIKRGKKKDDFLINKSPLDRSFKGRK